MNKREFLLTTASGIIGVLVGASIEIIKPYILEKKISDEAIDIYYREEINNEMLEVYISNNSDQPLDIIKISLYGKISEEQNLGIFLEPSQIYILDKNNKIKSDSIKTENNILHAEFNTRNTLKPGDRDIVNIKFISPSLDSTSIDKITLRTPDGKSISLDGEY